MDFGRFEEFWPRLATRKRALEGTATLEEALARSLAVWPSCAICHLLLECVFDLLSRWQYALGNDPDTQARFLSSQTWCNRHAWHFAGMASPLDLGRLHRRLMAASRMRLAERAGPTSDPMPRAGPDSVLSWLVGQRRCPMCDDQAALQRQLLDALARGVALGVLRSTYAASAGCCLPHLAMLLDTVQDAEAVAFLLQATCDQFDRLVQRLDRHTAKTLSRRRDFGEARYAPIEALTTWAGVRGMVQPPRAERD